MLVLLSLLLGCGPKTGPEDAMSEGGTCPRPDGMFGPVVLPQKV